MAMFCGFPLIPFLNRSGTSSHLQYAVLLLWSAKHPASSSGACLTGFMLLKQSQGKYAKELPIIEARKSWPSKRARLNLRNRGRTGERLPLLPYPWAMFGAGHLASRLMQVDAALTTKRLNADIRLCLSRTTWDINMSSLIPTIHLVDGQRGAILDRASNLASLIGHRRVRARNPRDKR